MKRDVVPKSTVATVYRITDNVNNDSLISTVDVELPNSGLTKERYMLEREFYKTYDPNIGFNTALVLGVMLSSLLLYVVYRTKIRKPLLAFVRRKISEFRHKGMTPDQTTFPDIEVHGNCENNDNEGGDAAECPDDVFYDEIEKSYDDRKYRLLPTFSLSDDDKQLPIVVMDMKSATADWVHKQHKFLEPGALILKVKSDTICPQGKEINPSKSPSNIYGAISQHCLAHAKNKQFIHN